jgi:hypothetical protein
MFLLGKRGASKKEALRLVPKANSDKTVVGLSPGEPGGEETFRDIIKSYSQKIFCERWAAWLGGLLLGFVNVMMFAYARPWGTADGMRNWGDWFFALLGFSREGLFSPFLYSTSVLNIGVIAGSFIASLLATEFAIRSSPPRELTKGLIGGTLMGIGANLAMGCNIGGFFSALSALSLSGLGMAVGLTMGAYLGLKYQLWELESGSQRSKAYRSHKKGPWLLGSKSYQPFLGLLFSICALVIVLVYDWLDYPVRGGLFIFGMVLGVICQRSRICFVKAFQEFFMPGEGEDTRGMLLAIAIATLGFSILKWNEFRSTTIFVYPAFWQGSLLGGIIFGTGMVLAGGCGAGSLWRAGEGQVKLWIALVGFALSGSLSRIALEQTGLINKLGKSIFLPEYLGWELSLSLVLGILLLWFLLISWSQASRKFDLLIWLIVLPCLVFSPWPGKSWAIDLSAIDAQDSFITTILQDIRVPQDLQNLSPLEKAHVPFFDVPRLVENGALVPITVRLDHPMDPDHYIKKLILIDEGSLIKIKFIVHLTPAWGKLDLSLPLKLARTTKLKAIVECSLHGRWLGISPEIRVTKGGCSAAVPEPNRHLTRNIFRTKFSPSPSSSQEFQVSITLKHPMESGLMLKDGSKPIQNFPPFFIKKLQLFDTKTLLGEWELGPGLSNNPRIRFFLKDKRRKKIRFLAINNEGQKYENTVLIRGIEEYF